MSGYVFLSNSNKPNIQEANNREIVKLSNVSKPWLEAALELGYDVWLGVNRNNPENIDCILPVHLYDSHTYRSLFNIKDNIIAYKNLMNILKNENIDVIHCNTPIGGMIGRICGKRKKVKKIIYTAHGFHFYKGAPLINNTILKWAEMIMAHWTDAIITMNKEDYHAAQRFKLKNGGKVYYIPGVGINTDEYKKVEINKTLRATLGIQPDDIICISMGDLIQRKNYQTSIQAIAKCKNRKIKFFVCGKGPELSNLQKLTKELNIEEQVKFLGFRSDVKELLKISDIFLFTTLQEGMPRSMMEAMASGLPCIASNIRGNVDLLEHGRGGFLVSPNNSDEIADRIVRLAKNRNERIYMGKNNLERIQKFDIQVVEDLAKKIYRDILTENKGR